MQRIRYFFECCFNQSEGFEDLDRIINNFKTSEIDEYQLQFIRELYYIIQTDYVLRSKSLSISLYHTTLMLQ